MNIVKGLLLGSAAVLVASSGAMAADLPVKAKAVEYVKVCSLYGPGSISFRAPTPASSWAAICVSTFWPTPTRITPATTPVPAGAQNRFTNGYTWRSREDLNVDTRTATEYGVVRTFFDATFSWTSDSYGAGAAAGSTVYSPIGTAAAPNNATSGGVAAGTVGVYYAFIQFAGFTIGKAVSQFSAPWANYPGNNFDGLVGGGGTITGVNQFTYTAQFGNGVSLSLSAQDQIGLLPRPVCRISVRIGTGALGPYGASDYRRHDCAGPDRRALRVDQAWGLFQASFAAHDNHAGLLWRHRVDRSSGRQVGLGRSTGSVDQEHPDRTRRHHQRPGRLYQRRDPLQHPGPLGGRRVHLLRRNTSVPGAYQSIGFGIAPDSVFVTGGHAAADHHLRPARRLRSQLEPVLEHQHLRCMGAGSTTTARPRATSAVRRNRCGRFVRHPARCHLEPDVRATPTTALRRSARRRSGRR